MSQSSNIFCYFDSIRKTRRKFISFFLFTLITQLSYDVSVWLLFDENKFYGE